MSHPHELDLEELRLILNAPSTIMAEVAVLHTRKPIDFRTCTPEEDPADMDTLGSLIDKLTIVNLKMWHNQEALYAVRRMTPDEFVQRYANDLPDLHATVARCCDLNVQRSRLMDAIDKLHADTVAGRSEAVTMPQHKTY